MIVTSIYEETALLEKLVSGDKTAFERLYETHYNTVFLFALHLIKSKQLAEEVAQEIFVNIWIKRQQVNPDLNFKAYLKKITLNYVLNFLKKASRDKALMQEVFANMSTLQNDCVEVMQEKHVQKVYDDAVCRLPSQKKLIFQLSRNNDFTYTEIASQLNLSKNTVKNHMVEALKMIRRSVSEQLF